MKNRTVRMTVFNAERMKNVVGVGSLAAYQIRVSPGVEVGALGKVDTLGIEQASNEDQQTCRRQPFTKFLNRVLPFFNF